MSKFHTIRYELLEFSEHLFYRTPIDGCFYMFWKHLFFRTIFYLKKSEKRFTLWIMLLPSAKNRYFSGFYCISIAVTNIILYVVWHLEHDRSILFYIWLKVYYQVLRFLSFISSNFLKSNWKWLPSFNTKHLETYLKLLISSFNCL